MIHVRGLWRWRGIHAAFARPSAETDRVSAKTITVNLKVWRQPAKDQPGRLVDYVAKDISIDMSFLEMLDVVNEDLIRKGEDTIAFDSDCREGICGACGCVINGVAHGPDRGATTCQLHMRRFSDGQTIVIEPWRAKGFPVLKDLTVDRSAFDRILAAGGYISVGVGGAQDANAIPVPKDKSDLAMDAAACIGCGACVAACKNAAAHSVHQRKNQPSGPAAAGRARTRAPRGADGRADGGRRLRQLLQRGRMRSRLPQTDPDFEHRADDSGIRPGDLERRGGLKQGSLGSCSSSVREVREAPSVRRLATEPREPTNRRT